MKKVLVLGGYGLFGQRIVAGLLRHHIPCIIVGRSPQAAMELAEQLRANAPVAVEVACFDIDTDLEEQLEALQPALVINTCGPFQLKNYQIARACIVAGVHYIDLADGRLFVKGVTELAEAAKQAQISVITGASTVPGLSSAVIEHYQSHFSSIDSLVYGIAPGQKTPRGLATTQAILTYLGRPIRTLSNPERVRYGWQDIYCQSYPVIGKRWMGNCDVPDLDLFPQYYGIPQIQFSAGMESVLLHYAIWGISWLIRGKPQLNLVRHARALLKASHLFDYGGSADGGMHMIFKGIGLDGQPKTLRWFIIATDGDGPQIPTIPAILLTKKILKEGWKQHGAFPCLGLITLPEYLAELAGFHVQVFSEAAE